MWWKIISVSTAIAEYFAPIIGYTGKVSAEELEELKKEDENYSSQ